MTSSQSVFVTGSTGFMGRRLIEELLRRGHHVKALARPGSESRVPSGALVITGNPLSANDYIHHIAPGDTVVQLVGVAHPSPWKTDQFRSVDFVAGREALQAARTAGAAHFVYVSVAMPAPIMKTYQKARADVETLIRQSGLSATILRPWYVLGPGRRWPSVMLPIYWLLEKYPATRNAALRLGFVTDEEMIKALVRAVENQTTGVRVWEVPEIRRGKNDR